jgi:hypothetical protein
MVATLTPSKLHLLEQGVHRGCDAGASQPGVRREHWIEVRGEYRIEVRGGSKSTRICVVSRMNRVYFMRGKMAAKVRDNPGGIYA